MKQFFEQYGGVALGILALLVLIAMITPVGNIIKTSLQGTVQTFSTKMDGQVDAMTESMNAAFTNATGFTGVKDHTYYFNGQVHPAFEEKGVVLSDDGRTAIDKDGINYIAVYADVNIILNDSGRRSSGIEGLLFDVYINGTLVDENVEDSANAISLNDNDEIKIVIKNLPDGYRTSKAEYVYKTHEQSSIWVIPNANKIYVDFLIYAYDA